MVCTNRHANHTPVHTRTHNPNHSHEPKGITNCVDQIFKIVIITLSLKHAHAQEKEKQIAVNVPASHPRAPNTRTPHGRFNNNSF